MSTPRAPTIVRGEWLLAEIVERRSGDVLADGLPAGHVSPSLFEQRAPGVEVLPHHFTFIPTRRNRPCRIVDGCWYDGVPKLSDRTADTAFPFKALNSAASGSKRTF